MFKSLLVNYEYLACSCLLVSVSVWLRYVPRNFLNAWFRVYVHTSILLQNASTLAWTYPSWPAGEITCVVEWAVVEIRKGLADFTG